MAEETRRHESIECALREERDTLRERVERLTSEAIESGTQHASQISELQQTIKEHRNEIQHLTSEAAQTSKDLDRKEDALQRLRSKNERILEIHDSQFTTLQSRIDDLVVALDLEKEKRKTAEAEARSLGHSRSQRLVFLGQQREQLLAQTSQLRNEVKQQGNATKLLGNENERLVNENKQLVNENTQLVNENTQLVSENTQLQSENQRLRSKNKQMTTVNEPLQSEIKRLANVNELLGNDIQQRGAVNKQQRVENKRLESENQQLGNDIKRLVSVNEQLSNGVKQLRAKESQLRSIAETTTQSLKEASDRLGAQADEISQLREQLAASAAAESKKLKQSLEKHAAAKRDVVRLTGLLDQANEKLQTLHQQLTEQPSAVGSEDIEFAIAQRDRTIALLEREASLMQERLQREAAARRKAEGAIKRKVKAAPLTRPARRLVANRCLRTSQPAQTSDRCTTKR